MKIIIESRSDIDINSFADIRLNGEFPMIYFDISKVKNLIRGSLKMKADISLMYEGLPIETATEKLIEFEFIYHEC